MDEEEFCYCHNDDTDEYHCCLDYMECEECPYYYADLDQVVEQMNTRKVDKSKKSNIKCEHCEAYDKDSGWCCIQEKEKNYWNRCKDFIWHHKY